MPAVSAARWRRLPPRLRARWQTHARAAEGQTGRARRRQRRARL